MRGEKERTKQTIHESLDASESYERSCCLGRMRQIDRKLKFEIYLVFS